MPKRVAPVTQADVTRTLKGVIAAGVSVDRIARVKTTPTGVEVSFIGSEPLPEGVVVNEWDEVLK